MNNNCYYQTLRQEISAFIISRKKEACFKKGNEFGNLIRELEVTVDFGQIITEQTNCVSFSGSAIISFPVLLNGDSLNYDTRESLYHFSGTAQVDKYHVVKVDDPITITY